VASLEGDSGHIGGVASLEGDSGHIGGVASLEGDNLEVFYYLTTSETWSDKNVDL
jgi:hypothetical protein